MVELVVVAGLSLSAAMALVRTTSLPTPIIVVLGPVAGLAAYVSSVTILVSVLGRADPPIAAGLVVLVALGIALRRGSDRATMRSTLTVGAVTALATGAAGVLASMLNATRLTPDSLSYLAVADILTEPAALERLRSFTIEARNLSTGALHTLGSLDGRPYSEIVTPVVTGFGTVAMLMLVGRSVTDHPRALRRAVVGMTAVFCLLAGRPLYDAFFVNSHGPLMVWFFAMVASGYMSAREGDTSWAVVAAIVAPAVLVARPEGPILVTIGLLPMVTHRSVPLKRRWLPIIPSLVVAVAWFGAAALAHPDLLGLSPSDPALPGVAMVAGVVIAAALASRESAFRVASALPWVVAVALGSIALYGAYADPGSMIATLQATATNLTTEGGWGLTWPVLLVLLAVAIACDPLPHARLLVAPIAGFAALYWASPVFREGSYRVGTGDSGNRMLAHVFLVVAFYIVVTISGSGDRALRRMVEGPEDSGGTDSGPIRTQSPP